MDQHRRQWFYIHDGHGTIGHGLTMDIAKGLSICEPTCYACIARLDKKDSELEEQKGQKVTYGPVRPVSLAWVKKAF